MNVRDRFERQALEVRICEGRREGESRGEREETRPLTASGVGLENSAEGEVRRGD